MANPSGARWSPYALSAALVRRTRTYRQVVADRDRLARENRRLSRASRQDLGHVFVVTYGRSGSTLLQGILNATPGWLIRGENGGAVYHLYRHYAAITGQPQSRRREVPFDTTDPWFGLDRYPRKRARAEIRRLVTDTLLRPERNTRVTGFKEIRWDQPDLLDYLRFLQRVFPGARFVFNTRNRDDVAASKWWARRPDPETQLARIEALHADAAAELGPDAAFAVHFDDYVHDLSSLRPLFAWLGEEYDEERIRTVLAVRHSY